MYGMIVLGKVSMIALLKGNTIIPVKKVISNNYKSIERLANSFFEPLELTGILIGGNRKHLRLFLKDSKLNVKWVELKYTEEVGLQELIHKLGIE